MTGGNPSFCHSIQRGNHNNVIYQQMTCHGQTVFIGTYSKGGGQGIYRMLLDIGSGMLGPAKLAAECDSPSFLTSHPSGKFLYAVNELRMFGGQNTGGVSAYEINPKTHDLELINVMPSHGQSPAHVVMDADGRHLLVANYNGPCICVFDVRPDGAIGGLASRKVHSGKGSHPVRQTTAHPHSVTVAPSGNHVLAADLGTDELICYNYDKTSSSPVVGESCRARLAPSSGPRHGVFHISGQYFYLICELAAEIAVFAFDAGRGLLSAHQVVPLYQSETASPRAAAEIKMHPSGRWLYASNRSDNSISVFSVSADGGKLMLVQRVDSGGRTPRHFALTVDGKFLLVANQESDELTLFSANGDDGTIKKIHNVNLPVPACVCMHTTCLAK
jgi:6-phosphogluconolactonase